MLEETKGTGVEPVGGIQLQKLRFFRDTPRRSEKMESTHLKKVLFVCSQNKFRSYTAEKIYEGFDQYQVRSRGTENDARIKITEGDIGWADIIFTMEKRHTNRIRKKFKEKIEGKRMITLFIEDIYDPMEPSLIFELGRKLSPHILFPPKWNSEQDGI